MILEFTVAAAEAAEPTDYTPAFIGLGGAIAGGLIGVTGQWFARKSERTSAQQDLLGELVR